MTLETHDGSWLSRLLPRKLKPWTRHTYKIRKEVTDDKSQLLFFLYQIHELRSDPRNQGGTIESHEEKLRPGQNQPEKSPVTTTRLAPGEQFTFNFGEKTISVEGK